MATPPALEPCRSIQGLGFGEQAHSFQRRGHVGAFHHDLAAVAQQFLGVFLVELVLDGARQSDIHGNVPRPAAGMELHSLELVGVILHAVAAGRAHFQHEFNLFTGNAVLVIHVAVGTGNGHNLGAQIIGLDGGPKPRCRSRKWPRACTSGCRRGF